MIYYVINRERIFRFLHIFTDSMQFVRGNKCRQFNDHRIHRKIKILEHNLEFREYFGVYGIFCTNFFLLGKMYANDLLDSV